MSDELLDGIDASVWRRRANFSHCVDSSIQIDHLNNTGGVAISFAPLGRGAVHLAFSGSQSKSLSIWTTQSLYGFLSVPKFRNELYSIRFVTDGSMVRNNRDDVAFIGRRGRATFLAFDDMIEDRASAGFSALTATVTRDAILLAHKALEGELPRRIPHFMPVVDVTSPGLLILQQILSQVHARLQTGIAEFDFIFPLMEEILVYQLISIWPKLDVAIKNPALSSNISLRFVVDYIEANLAKKITIAEIATISGLGVRSLQISFRRQFGCTPFQGSVGDFSGYTKLCSILMEG